MIDVNARAIDDDCLSHILLAELTDVGAFLMDSQRRITSWSPGIEHILGYSKEEFIGMDAGEIFTQGDREKKLDEAEFSKARLKGRAPDMRWHLKKDGSHVFVNGVLRSISDEHGAHIGYAKIMRDINPSRIGDSMLTAILDRTPDAISLKDEEGRFTFVNSELARLVGRKPEELIGRTSDEVFPPDISGMLRENDISVVEGEGPQIIEEQMLTSEHGQRTFLSGKGPWRDGDGNIIGVVSISQDISARKSAEEERERLLKQLRRSNEDLEDFAHVVAHDLQAPLRMVKSYTELLAQRYQGELDTTADEFISFILDGTAGMEMLIKGLLRYAKAGEEAVTRSAVPVNAVLAGVRANLQPLIEESRAELLYQDLPTVRGDAVQLLQLLQNLISNAIKYAKADVAPKIHVSAERIGPSEYRFAVKDNGEGIDSKYFDRIFAPLKRLHGQEIPGTGIGLAVCKKIIERHGGRIWLASQPGNGSTFYFTLPAVH